MDYVVNERYLKTNDMFDAREKALCAFSLASGQTPNAVTTGHYVELRKHFSETEIVDLVAVISLFGFLNRWNETMATPLESGPAEFASSHLAQSGWEQGKHG